MDIDDPGGVIAVKPGKSGLKAIGVKRCGTCHEIQQVSWEESGHGKRDPPLDCEGCHGPGSEYKRSSVMKDAKKARAAGLVDPPKEFCAKCHRDPWTEEMIEKVHAKGEVTADEDEEE